MEPVKMNIDDTVHIAEIRLNRPGKMNSLTYEMCDLLWHCFDEIERNESIRAIILAGEGRAFCTGSDLNERLKQNLKPVFGGDPYIIYLRKILTRLAKMGIPTIAAINGHAVGGGLEIALACDIRIASEKAKLGLPEVKVGTIAAGGGTQRLPRLVGSSKAKELILTGELIDAPEAFRIGLVNRVVSSEEVVETAWEFARVIASRAPLATRISKLAVEKGIEMNLEDGLDLESSYSYLLSGTSDRQEGINAFVEKREPIFIGK